MLQPPPAAHSLLIPGWPVGQERVEREYTEALTLAQFHYGGPAAPADPSSTDEQIGISLARQRQVTTAARAAGLSALPGRPTQQARSTDSRADSDASSEQNEDGCHY